MSRKRSAFTIALILVGTTAFAGAAGVVAASPGVSEDSEPPPITASSVEDFVDRTVGAYMRNHHIAGVTVAVVDRNGSLLEKGYGIEQLNPRKAVDPTRSLFAFGSISKTFTALAAMQLSGSGKLDMDADVNRYLPPDLRLAANGFPPVRVRDLLTHSAADMARYLRFLLGNGSLDGTPIMSEGDFRAMVTINFRNMPDDGAEAIAHGWFRKRYGRYLSLEKSGDTLFFSANMVALPEAGLGVFVALNTDARSDELRDRLPTQVFEHFLRDARPETRAPAFSSEVAGLDRFAGWYLEERRN